MRIKKYENWKFTNHTQGSIFSSHRQRPTDLFSISQLLETPKKSLHQQDEHHKYIFTDPQIVNHTFNINRRILNKKDIQINQFVKPVNRSEREQNIKNKIKERIKEEIANQNFIQPPKTPQNKQSQLFNFFQETQSKKPVHKQGRVFIKGNSVPFNSLDQRKRSKSSLMRTSMPNFNKKQQLQKVEKMINQRKQNTFKHKFYSVQMKRKVSSGFASRQKTFSYVKNKNPLKDIQPWQIDEGPQIFEL